MSTLIPLPSERPTVPIWPDAGRALGFNSKSGAYRAAKTGHIPTVQLSARHWVVPTAALRTLLWLPFEDDRTATAPVVSDPGRSA